MRQNVSRLTAARRLVRRQWPLLIVVLGLGAVAGLGASAVVSPGYVATSRVLLQGDWEKTDLQTQVLVATSSTVLDKVAASTGTYSGTELKDRVKAGLGGGTIIELTATARTPELAQRIADRTTQEYVIFAAQLVSAARDSHRQVADARREVLVKQLDDHRIRIAQLRNLPPSTPQSVRARAGADAAALSDETTRLEAELKGTDSSDTQASVTSALRSLNVVILEPARLPEHAALPSRLHCVLGGMVLSLLGWSLFRVSAASRDPRLRTPPDIEAASGARLVGTVEVVVPADAPGWRERVRRMIQNDVPWDVPALPATADRTEPDPRYRRAIERLRRDLAPELRLAVLVDKHDAAARRAVVGLAAAAGKPGDPTVVVTDSPHFADLVASLRTGPSDTAGPVTVLTPADPIYGRPRTVLRLVETTVERPAVPEDVEAAAVLITLTAGTRTAWEVAGLTEACRDSGLDVVGVLMTHRAEPPRPRAGRNADGPRASGTDPDADALTDDAPAAETLTAETLTADAPAEQEVTS